MRDEEGQPSPITPHPPSPSPQAERGTSASSAEPRPTAEGEVGPRSSLDAVFQRIEGYREEMARSLSELLRFDTVWPPDAEDKTVLTPGLRQALDWVMEKARAFGLSCREVGGMVGVVESPHPAPSFAGSPLTPRPSLLGVLLHLDVVPPGDGWTHPPFSGAIIGDEVWGRGATDDKGPCVSVLYALRGLAEGGFFADATLRSSGATSLRSTSAMAPPRRRVRVLFGTDEESGVWADMAAYLSAEEPPELSFVPDGRFPITNGEKGFLNALFIARSGPALDRSGRSPHRPQAERLNRAGAETGPSGDRAEFVVEVVAAGERPNIVPQHARAILLPKAPLSDDRLLLLARRCEDYNEAHPSANVSCERRGSRLIVHAQGSPAHGSRPQVGHSALLDLVDFLAAEKLDDGGPAQMIRFLCQAIGFDLNGAKLGIYAHHDFLGSTTVNIGLVETHGDECRATANIRTVIGQDCEEVLRSLKDAAARFNEIFGGCVEVERSGRSHEPLYVPPETELVQGLARAYERVMGEKAGFEAMGGTTFAKALPNAAAFGPCLPTEPDLAHQADERVSIEALVRNAKVYAAAIVELAG